MRNDANARRKQRRANTRGKLMKWRNAILIALVLALSILAGAATAYADDPQPFVYPMVKCSGLPVATLVQAEQQFDTEYGWAHGLVTDWQWRASYEERVNEFAALLGCPQVLDNGALTRWYVFYVPTYGRILRGETP